MQKILLDELVQDGFLRFLEDLATPRALSVALMMKHAEWDQLTELKFYPSNTLLMSSKDTLGINAVKRDYQATELLRKAAFLPSTKDLDKAARTSFINTEAQCMRTNARLEFLHTNALPACCEEADPSGALRRVVQRIKKEIRSLLGPVPNQIAPAFGPGSVFEVALDGCDSSGLTVLDKLDRLQPAVTAECADIFQHYYAPSAWGRWQHPRWSGPQIVRSNRFATVPKDSTKHRVIGVEPGGNIWLQKGVGTYIRSRLQERWGLLLPEGKSERLHHRMAKIGSATGQFATVDLSNASDTVARRLVEVLLPPDWYDLLDALRVKFTLVDGRMYWLEKFSSMGNGFTFELETLIFAAIARALVNTGYAGNGLPHVSVYGDDIIVPTPCARDVIAALRFFGFTPNPRKTFVTGYFRESCGGDFIAGVSVAPVRVVELPTEPAHWISLCNGIHRTWDRESRGDPGHRFWHWAHAQLPKSVQRCQGPSEYGDVCIHWNKPRLVRVHDTQSWRPRLYQPSFVHKRMDRHCHHAILAYALLGGSSEGPVPRGPEWISGYHIRDPKGCTCRPGRAGGSVVERCNECKTSSADSICEALHLQNDVVGGVRGFKTLKDHARGWSARSRFMVV